MTSWLWLWLVAALALGTYGMRLIGPLAGLRLRLTPATRRVFDVAPVVLLVSLAALSSLAGEAGAHGGPDIARLLGVATGVLLAWRRAPMLVVVLGAAAVTALLRA